MLVYYVSGAEHIVSAMFLSLSMLVVFAAKTSLNVKDLNRLRLHYVTSKLKKNYSETPMLYYIATVSR